MGISWPFSRHLPKMSALTSVDLPFWNILQAIWSQIRLLPKEQSDQDS